MGITQSHSNDKLYKFVRSGLASLDQNRKQLDYGLFISIFNFIVWINIKLPKTREYEEIIERTTEGH